MTFFITFTCYGSHLHGQESGSVSPGSRVFGGPLLEPNAKLFSAEQQRMAQPPYRLDRSRREAVLKAVENRCNDRGWKLQAAHVRTNHVHLVVTAEARPERIMNDLKSFASRHLNELEVEPPLRKRWTRHGSTRWLWNRKEVAAAIEYLIGGQGTAMAVFIAPEPLG